MTRIFVLAVLMVCCGSNIGAGQKVHWTNMPRKPDAIVIGELVEVSRAVLALPWPRIPDDHRTLSVKDVGVVDVEQVVFGDESLARIPVVWTADTWRVPQANLTTVSSGNEWHGEGERRIWVLWSFENEWGGLLSGTHFYFQALPIDSLSAVRADVATHLQN